MKTGTKAPITYSVETRRTGSREYRKMALGFLHDAAVAEVYSLFGRSTSIAQIVMVNEKSGRVVARYEQDYDSAKRCFVVKRVATR